MSDNWLFWNWKDGFYNLMLLIFLLPIRAALLGIVWVFNKTLNTFNLKLRENPAYLEKQRQKAIEETIKAWEANRKKPI